VIVLNVTENKVRNVLNLLVLKVIYFVNSVWHYNWESILWFTSSLNSIYFATSSGDCNTSLCFRRKARKQWWTSLKLIWCSRF
jgi:hypothetical protein